MTRVTVLGGGKRKVATKDRRGAVTERYDVRWRVQLRSGETRMFRQRFDRSVDADGLVRRLQAVGLPASGWHLDDDGRPSNEPCFVGKPQYAALALVMGGAGLRIGECCELRRRDCVDGPNGGMWISVRGTLATPGRTWTDSGDGFERRGTKAKGPDGDLRGRRTYLQPAEAAVLRTHLEQFSARPADARVFTSTTGRHLDVAHLQQRAWKRARELAFLEGHRLHDVGRHALRHLDVTRWLRAGVPLRTAARWGGWKDVATMLRWYESRLPGDDELAAGRLAVPVGEHTLR
ncbi:MAG: tyrosine-type recombinase/integrase [Ilumatobacteraceae bacterium]